MPIRGLCADLTATQHSQNHNNPSVADSDVEDEEIEGDADEDYFHNAGGVLKEVQKVSKRQETMYSLHALCRTMTRLWIGYGMLQPNTTLHATSSRCQTSPNHRLSPEP
jgi:hypothetical protein